MQNLLHTDVPFNAADFRIFTSELSRFEKLKGVRPHFPEISWLEALAETDRRHTARALNFYHHTLDALKLARAPTTIYHEHLYSDPGPLMNHRPLKLASA